VEYYYQLNLRDIRIIHLDRILQFFVISAGSFFGGPSMQDALAKSGQGRPICTFRAILVPMVLIVAFILTTLGPAAAAPVAAEILIDAASGQVLFQSNADAATYPASLTKMMTLYLVFEAVQKGQLRLDQPLPISMNAARKPATNLALTPGGVMTVNQAISAMVIRSANDAATVVAEGMSGSEAAFAEKMNAKATALGMTRTFFRNPNGLPDPLQHTTARDIARLAMAIYRDFPQFYPRFAETRFTFRNRTYFTHNRMVLRYPGVDGLKTGYIHLSGFNLATSAVRAGRRLFGVVLGGRSPSLRDAQMWAMLDQGFATSTPKMQNNSGLMIASASSPGLVPSLRPDEPAQGAVDNAGSNSTDSTDDTESGSDGVPAPQLASLSTPVSSAPSLTAESPIAASSQEQPQTSQAQAASALVASAQMKSITLPAAAAPVLAVLPVVRSSTGSIQVATNGPLPVLKPASASASENIGVADGIVSLAVNGNRYWGVQVGAYSRYTPARQAAVRARQHLPFGIRESRIAVDETASPGGKMYYRARVIGLAQGEALDACRQLKAKRMSCLVVQSRVAMAMSSGE
jgi:D-alanyl-D-alanine carboxypeptidase